MQFLLFVNFNNGLMHNCVHKKLEHTLQSVRELLEDEGLNATNEGLPTLDELKSCINKNDDFYQQLSNGTWFHIQPQNVFEVVK